MPKVRVSTDGTKASALWVIQKSKTVEVLQTSSATISGNVATWGAPVGFSIPSSGGTTGGSLALAEDGATGALVWTEASTDSSSGKAVTTYDVKAASGVITGSTATWGRATRLSGTEQIAKNAAIAISSAGTAATAVWQRSDTNAVRH